MKALWNNEKSIKDLDSIWFIKEKNIQQMLNLLFKYLSFWHSINAYFIKIQIKRFEILNLWIKMIYKIRVKKFWANISEKNTWIKKVRTESQERLENHDFNSKCVKIAVNIISYKKKESDWKGNI